MTGGSSCSLRYAVRIADFVKKGSFRFLLVVLDPRTLSIAQRLDLRIFAPLDFVDTERRVAAALVALHASVTTPCNAARRNDSVVLSSALSIIC